MLLLERLVQDIGADRWLIVAELGFQAGAIRSSQHSNITLTSLEDLRANTEDERARAELASFAVRINALNEERRRLWEWAPPNSKGGPIPIDRMVEFAARAFELHSLVLPRIATNQFPIMFGYRERVVAKDAAALKSVLVRILTSVTEEADALWTLVRAGADHAVELLEVLSLRLTELVAAGRGLDLEDTVSGREFVAAMRAVSDAADAVTDIVPSDVRIEVRTLMRWLIDEVYMQAAEGRLDWDQEQPRLAEFTAAAGVALTQASDTGRGSPRP